MLARIRKAQEEKEGGFTLIELLVVMIIIGILAAIAIPVFLSQRAKAQDSATKADVSSIGKELATYYVDADTTGVVAISGDKYVFTPTGGTAITLGRASANVTVKAGTVANIAGASAWCVGLTNTKGDKQDYKYSSAAGLAQGACSGSA
jgi:prepilin-type N-terminal cleavage/methylation domain-containing protein